MHEEQTSSFVFDSLPIAAYDRSLASVSLRTDRNTPGTSYPVYISATFGSQIVKIQAGSTLFEVVFEIYEAEILLNAVRTDLDYGRDYHEQNSILNKTRKNEISTISNTSGEAQLTPSSPKLGLKLDQQNQKKMAYDSLPRNYEHPSLTRLQIGRRTNSEPLEGTAIRDYQGWIATQLDQSLTSGVRAELNVRESWVKFKKPATNSRSIVAKAWNKLSASDSREVAEKKILFAELLKILAIKKLSSANDPDVATLDLDAILCVPAKDQIKFGEQRYTSVPTLIVDENILLEFLQTPTALTAQFVKNVKNKSAVDKPKKKSFVPHCSVASAFDCWSKVIELAESDTFITEEEAIRTFGRNEIKDLSSAELIEKKGDIIIPINPFPILEAEGAFKAFLSRKPTLRFVYDLLVDDPEMEPIIIGERVGTFLNKDWKPSTCRSNGHRLRSWTGYVFAELLIVGNMGSVARYLGANKKKSSRRGRSSIWHGENLEEVKRLERSGATITEAAAAMGVTRQVFYNKRRLDPDFWSKHFSTNGKFSRKL